MSDIVDFPTCSLCGGLGWVCETHNDKPFEHDDCGGDGYPCPRCNVKSVYGEEAAKEIQSLRKRVEELEEEFVKLKTPAGAYINTLRGNIAKLSPATLPNVYTEQQLKEAHRIASLKKAALDGLME